MIHKERAGRSSGATQRLLCHCPTSYVFPALVPSHGRLSRNKTKSRKEAQPNESNTARQKHGEKYDSTWVFFFFNAKDFHYSAIISQSVVFGNSVY